MRKALGKLAQVLLRRVFLAPRNRVRLRRSQKNRSQGESRVSLIQYVALLGISSPSGRLSRSELGWRNAAGIRAAPRQKMASAESLREERRRVLSVPLLQGSRRRHSACRRAPLRIQNSRLLFDRQSCKRGRRAIGAARL